MKRVETAATRLFNRTFASSKTVTFSPEQQAVVDLAVRKVRLSERDDTLTPARCLELILADWLSGS